MIRVAALVVGLALGALMVMFGLVVTVRMLFPEWSAVPGALMQMTSQKVPAV